MTGKMICIFSPNLIKSDCNFAVCDFFLQSRNRSFMLNRHNHSLNGNGKNINNNQHMHFSSGLHTLFKVFSVLVGDRAHYGRSHYIRP